jgi:hypothetical protein
MKGIPRRIKLVARYHLTEWNIVAFSLFSLTLGSTAAPPPSELPSSLGAALPATASTTPESQPGDNAWGVVIDGLRSRIWIGQMRIGTKAAILVHYEIQNASDGEKVVWHSGFWPNHRIQVTAPNGHPAAMTRLGEQTRKIADSGIVEKNYPVSLRPGTTDTDWPVLNLRDYFRMDAPGEYTVQYLYLHDGSVLASNRLKLMVDG